MTKSTKLVACPRVGLGSGSVFVSFVKPKNASGKVMADFQAVQTGWAKSRTGYQHPEGGTQSDCH